MSKVVLSQLAESLAQKNGLSQHVAETFARTMFDVINQGLVDDKLVKVKGLGTFKVTSVKDRESVDVNTGARILIEGRDKINFVPDATLRDLVNKPFAQFETVIINDGVDFSEIDRKFESSEKSKEEEVEETPLLDIDTSEEIEENTVSEEEKPSEEERVADEDSIIVDNPEMVNDPSLEQQEAVVEVEQSQNVPETEDAPIEASEPIMDEQAVPNSSESTEPVIEIVEKEPNVYKYIALIISTMSFVLIVCLGLLAYQYHKVVMERNQLSMFISEHKMAKDSKVTPKEKAVSQAKVDSVRMHEVAKAVTSAEEAKKKEETRLVKADKDSVRTSIVSSQYDKDPRVRTGAYRIIGVSQTVTVEKGQTLSTISRSYLGPGMECYVEALNGITTVKEGQKLKIPKLELRRKR